MVVMDVFRSVCVAVARLSASSRIDSRFNYCESATIAHSMMLVDREPLFALKEAMVLARKSPKVGWVSARRATIDL